MVVIIMIVVSLGYIYGEDVKVLVKHFVLGGNSGAKSVSK